MAYRILALVSLAVVAALAAGCADQPANGGHKVYRPLFESSYSHDVVAPRAPPPFETEPMQERRGYVWAHSYYRWDGHDFVRVPAQWITAKPDARYVDAAWERHRDGWHFKPGYWISY